MSHWNQIIEQARAGNLAPPRRVEKTPEEWRGQLSDLAYAVTREHGTERPFSDPMCAIFEPGRYGCACCGTPLFDATHKFDSGTGWPSFTAPLEANVIAYHVDTSHGMTRVETLCNVCDAHLGHVFPDGPAPTGLRYCMNAVALEKIAE
jgi:methionine-R-sulfoxide reductase